MKRSVFAAFLVLGAAAFAGGPVWTAADGFADVNPNGEWAFGRIDNGAFNPHSMFHPGNLARWDSGQPFPASYPAAVKNTWTEPIFFGGDVPLQPGEIAISPGSNAPSVARWTAPANGDYAIAATFQNQDEIGDGFTVRVLINNDQVFFAALLSAKLTATYEQTHTLALGSTVDFAVYAHTGDIFGDVSGLDATIELLNAGSCPEDLDLDGDVDFADLNIVLGDFNTSGPDLDGDVDGDGDVDFADLNRVLGLFNTEC